MKGGSVSATDAGRLNVAVDGPAGAGKSTIARMLAERLGIIYIDTGAMYRACAVKAIRAGIPLDDEPRLERMMLQTRIDFVPVGQVQRVMLDGEDVTEAIRTPDATRGSSDIARSRAVRGRLVEMQRGIARSADVVMDGRDIGSVVLPDAPYKFFLTATDEVRATRRLMENRQKGTGLQEYEEVLSDLRYRDRQDSTRELSPLLRVPDAVLIDTSCMDADAVVEKILEYILKGRAGSGTP
ncbi:MAG: (d)CMP kinase [Clostridia bacterium]|nr:(d)CMP kinase [Clostridia bacterium]